MRKKIWLCTWIALLMVLPLLGCGQDKETSARPNANGQKNTVTSVLEAGMADAVEQPAAAPIQAATARPKTKQPAAAFAPVSRIDVDLASLSSTMVYSEVYAMMEHPRDYVGKVVRMHGVFTCSRDSSTGGEYYFCVIQDATACCAQGLEFEPGDAYLYPDDYPEPGKEITVLGTFDSYREDAGNGYYYVYLVLRNASLL